MRQLKEFNFDDDDIIEVYSNDQLIYSGKYVDIPEDLTLYAVQKKLRIYNCLENIFKEDSSEEDRSVFKYALTLLILVLLSNALWFGIVQEL